MLSMTSPGWQRSPARARVFPSCRLAPIRVCGILEGSKCSRWSDHVAMQIGDSVRAARVCWSPLLPHSSPVAALGMPVRYFVLPWQLRHSVLRLNSVLSVPNIAAASHAGFQSTTALDCSGPPTSYTTSSGCCNTGVLPQSPRGCTPASPSLLPSSQVLVLREHYHRRGGRF